MRPLDIAEKLTGPGRYKFDDLVAGIEGAQFGASLQPNSYLVLLWATHFGYNDCWDEILMLIPRPDAIAAMEQATEATRILLLEGAKQIEEGRGPALNLSVVPAIGRFSVRFDGNTQFDKHYVMAMVLGPFLSVIIGQELIDLFASERFALWSYFTDRGTPWSENTRGKWTDRAKGAPAPKRPNAEQLSAWVEAQVAQLDKPVTGPPAGSGGYTAEELMSGVITPTVEYPPDYFRNPEQIEAAADKKRGRPEGEPKNSAWMRAQVLWNTTAMTDQEKMEWVENRITKL